MKNYLLSISEFAKLCKTQKGTLLFYDKKNIFKPRKITEKGYRYYSPEQYFEFEMISMFKNLGSSLKEIKTYAHHADGKNFLEFLEEKKYVAKKELQKLKQRLFLLENMIESLQKALDYKYDAVTVEHHNEEYLEVWSLGDDPSESDVKVIQRFAEYVDLYKNKKQKPYNIFGFILSINAARHKETFETHSFHKASRNTPRSRLHIKKEGNYVVLAHKGNDETHGKVLVNMLNYIQNNNMTIKSEIYAYDMVSYAIQENNHFYTCKYCILVE